MRLHRHLCKRFSEGPDMPSGGFIRKLQNEAKVKLGHCEQGHEGLHEGAPLISFRAIRVIRGSIQFLNRG